MAEEPREQVSWNIASTQAKHISSLIERATKFYLAGNLGNWYWTLTAIRENMNYELEKPEKKRLSLIEKTCNSYHSQWANYKSLIDCGKKPSTELKKSKVKFSSAVRIYQRQIFQYLKTLGFFPSKEDRTKLSF